MKSQLLLCLTRGRDGTVAFVPRLQDLQETFAYLTASGFKELRVWHVDPLRCPVCQSPMRVIAVIDDPRVVERVLRHLGAWHAPPAGLSPPGAAGPYTYEPCQDVEPMPDYENVLTD